MGPNLSEYSIPYVFLPKSRGNELIKFLDSYQDSSFTVVLKIGSADFDWSILILLCMSVVMIVLSSIWNLIHFRKETIDRASRKAAETDKTNNKKYSKIIEKIKLKLKSNDIFISISFIIFFFAILVGTVILTHYFYKTMGKINFDQNIFLKIEIFS